MSIPNIFAFFLAQQENILSVDGSFFFILFLFILLVFLLNRLIFKPILQVLDERDRLTVGASGEASSIVDDYNQRLSHYETTIRQARADSYRQLEHRRTQSLGERTQIIEQAKAEAAAQIEVAKAELHQQVTSAKDNLQTEAQTIARQISSAILKRPVGGETR